MNTITYIALLKNQHRIVYNRADGTVGDKTSDTVITRDPNDHLAPLAGGSLLHILIIIAVSLAIIAMVIYLSKQVKTAA